MLPVLIVAGKYAQWAPSPVINAFAYPSYQFTVAQPAAARSFSTFRHWSEFQFPSLPSLGVSVQLCQPLPWVPGPYIFENFISAASIKLVSLAQWYFWTSVVRKKFMSRKWNQEATRLYRKMWQFARVDKISARTVSLGSNMEVVFLD